jgi:hypothetical protein
MAATLATDSAECKRFVGVCTKTGRVNSRIENPASVELLQSVSLEDKFCAQLHEARRIGADDLAEVGAADVAVDGLRPEKLGMIENVETLDPKLQRLRFGKTHVFEKRHIVVVHSRAVEETPLRRAWRSQGVLAELGGIEIRVSVARIVI